MADSVSSFVKTQFDNQNGGFRLRFVKTTFLKSR